MTILAEIDHTHDPALRSWVPGADGHPDFPVQNLPMCSFALGGVARAGVLIGDHVFGLAALVDTLEPCDEDLRPVITAANLDPFCALPAPRRKRLRALLSACLTGDGDARHRASLHRIADVDLAMPATVGDFSDFFAGIHHAMTAGRFFRPDEPLLPNYKHVPIAYHGRSSSVVASGQRVSRPSGQVAPHGATMPEWSATRRLDFELEIAFWIGGGNAVGQPLPIAQAGDALVGIGLLNDWSARDIQGWETKPLGPFLGKSFLTTVSPAIVTTEALAPFRQPQLQRPAGDPAPQPYLLDDADQANGAFAVNLEVALLTQTMRRNGEHAAVITRSSGLDLYWTAAQMIAHHASNGCNLRPGDLFGSGTVSGPAVDGHGSLLEHTGGGRTPLVLPNGETRLFLEDGDEVILRGWCEREGFARIGLGEARGIVG